MIVISNHDGRVDSDEGEIAEDGSEDSGTAEDASDKIETAEGASDESETDEDTGDEGKIADDSKKPRHHYYQSNPNIPCHRDGKYSTTTYFMFFYILIDSPDMNLVCTELPSLVEQNQTFVVSVIEGI